ncbi:MAG: acyl-CoA dehydrogenase [Cyanobacteria bacterium SID2]|nr:acyl-CoA dehydrogenase [Cyanobacteria bacterium SID2]MBP0004266.1 acyl-CoA dehydrogenase [Cyanobacteria bacterium SBC]
MKSLEQYRVAEALERDLGDPMNPNSTLSFARVVELDEQEAFPEDELTWLYRWKLQDYYVPESCGGKFKSFETFVAFVRVLCRRDQTTGIAFTTLFWSFLTWMAGTPAQKAKLARFVRDRHGAMCLGYSEREHGADLMASDLTATKVPGGYVLNGEKWPINRATISGVSYILAKTDPSAGARGLSLLMVEKDRLDPQQFYNLPKIRTHGIRGSDMSGIGFHDCFVPEDMLLGSEGAGLELALKGFQITRTLCAAFSHGAADTALRTTLNFARSRVVYGKTVFDLPQPQRVLVDAFLDVLICDCETISAARGFHVVPGQFGVWAAVVKYFVTVRLEKAIADLSVVLGARFYMREEHDWGIFQKQLRDNAIISVFDGSTVVNLHALILQLRQLARVRERGKAANPSQTSERLAAIFDLTALLPTFDPNKLELFARGADDVVQGLEATLEKLSSLSDDPSLDAEVLDRIQVLSERIPAAVDDLDFVVAKPEFEHGHEQPPEMFEAAKQYCTLHAAAACVHFWVYNRTQLTPFFAEGKWLVLALDRLLRTFRPSPISVPIEYVESVAAELLSLHRQNKMFSIVPFQLAQSIQKEESSTDASSKLQLQTR